VAEVNNVDWKIIPYVYYGGAENNGHENDGPSKLQGMKLQDMKLQEVTEKYIQNSLFVGSRFCSCPLYIACCGNNSTL